MPLLILICIFVVLPFVSLLLAIKTSGKKKILAWGVFALLALPLAVGGAGGLLLAAYGLAWRSCVKLPVGFTYVAGISALLVWAGVFLWRQIEDWRTVVREIGRMAILLGTGFLVIVLGWFCMFCAAVWAGSDRVTEYNGQVAVAEQTWTDWDYYAYHGGLVRGNEVLGHSYNRVPEAKEPEPAEEELDAKARKKVSRALRLDIPDSGEVQRRDDTHGGFHNDGETYIQIRFNEDDRAVLEQIEASAEWTALPLPAELRTLAGYMNEVWLPTDEELGEGYYWFRDRHSESEDRSDYSAARGRYSYNFSLAFYSIGEKTLCFCMLDT